ncbi:MULTISPECIES: hypothetical protein [unclassified Rhodococcus (in: high G+C Gram-positive bacteria)]|uniref:PPE domain-containing protein n=1 Tax=unclassified Rhodococcus (in: high G+C Gram-positive bacteria) TaxID=192944 RepID=UPI003391ABFE
MSGDPSEELQQTLRTLESISGFGDMSAQEFGDLTRAVVYQERDSYAYSGGYEPKAVFDDDPFEAMSHGEIFGKVEQFQPERAEESSNNWRAIGAHAAEGADQFAQAMAAVNSTSWQGPSATAAVDGVQAYTKSTAELKTTAHLVANKLLEAYTGLQQTKASVPPPLATGPFEKVLDAVPGFIVPGALKQAQHAREEAEEAARQVMRSVYMPVVHQSDDQVPILPTALDPVTDGGSGDAARHQPGTKGPGFDAQPFSRADTAATGPESGNGASGQAGSPASDGGALRSPASDTRDTGTEASSWAPGDATQSPQPPTGPAGAQQGANAPSLSSPTGSSPGGSVLGSPLGGPRGSGPGGSGLGGSGLGGSGSRGGSSGGAGSRFGGGSGGSGSGGSGSGSGTGGLSRPGVGGSVLGAPGQGSTAAGGQGSAGGSGTAAGRAGAPGMGGMSPGAGRGGPGGADDVHKTPGYLVDAVNGDELIGTLPLVVPPVLGG